MDAIVSTAGRMPPTEIPEGMTYAEVIRDPIRRDFDGQTFTYFDAKGRKLRDPDTLARIAALAIPPAYTDVLISPDPTTHLQATGRDDRGRKQYRYHPDWMAFRSEAKFALMPAFANALPRIRETVDADLRRRRPDQLKVLAAVVWLLDNLLIRVGNETYVYENGSYGLTTLRNRHVNFVGGELQFSFRGKSGKQWQLSYRDRRISNAIRKLQELPGQQLFQYLDESGNPHAVRSQDVNAYIRDASGENFSSRQFRTWGATSLAAVSLAALEPEQSERARKRQINSVIDQISGRLMNTRAVCRASYIHPQVFTRFEDGSLSELFRIRLAPNAKAAAWMDDDERRVAKWLQLSTMSMAN